MTSDGRRPSLTAAIGRVSADRPRQRSRAASAEPCSSAPTGHVGEASPCQRRQRSRTASASAGRVSSSRAASAAPGLVSEPSHTYGSQASSAVSEPRQRRPATSAKPGHVSVDRPRRPSQATSAEPCRASVDQPRQRSQTASAPTSPALPASCAQGRVQGEHRGAGENQGEPGHEIGEVTGVLLL